MKRSLPLTLVGKYAFLFFSCQSNVCPGYGETSQGVSSRLEQLEKEDQKNHFDFEADQDEEDEDDDDEVDVDIEEGIELIYRDQLNQVRISTVWAVFCFYLVKLF